MPFATVNPATGLTEQTFEAHTPEEVEAKVARAYATYLEYRRTSFAERSRLLITAAELMEAEVPDMARILTTEMGKTFAAAKGEVSKCAMSMRWFADNAEALLADEVVASAAKKSYLRFEPLGVVLAVMPWNFPLWQVIRFAAPALMLGNTGLLKHASNVPQSALLLEDVFRRAGFPEGVFTTLLIEAKDVAPLIEDPRIAAVTLTGSEGAGMAVASAAGHALKKSVMELGGSDAFVVLESADLAATARAAASARTINNGQSCIAAKRFIVVEPVAEEFTRLFVEAMSSLVVGDPFDPATNVGPIVSEAQRQELLHQIEEAKQEGAVVACGGTVPDRPGWYLDPTVLTNIKPDMEVAQQELFGPVALVLEVPDLDAAIAAANSTTFGLGSSVWGTDQTQLDRCVREIEAGSVFVNAAVASNPELPFGGIKRSGFGRELSEVGLKEFCNVKTVWIS
ncbi:MAG TPA: NAD-dependent succinate-semialdehyde dehydrogenase [Acidimicrobiales bacterium]|jgi:succinate-semialdehyde dehydrogenase/glutarate-semialdehyde dehydrogenase